MYEILERAKQLFFRKEENQTTTGLGFAVMKIGLGGTEDSSDGYAIDRNKFVICDYKGSGNKEDGAKAEKWCQTFLERDVPAIGAFLSVSQIGEILRFSANDTGFIGLLRNDMGRLTVKTLYHRYEAIDPDDIRKPHTFTTTITDFKEGGRAYKASSGSLFARLLPSSTDPIYDFPYIYSYPVTDNDIGMIATDDGGSIQFNGTRGLSAFFRNPVDGFDAMEHNIARSLQPYWEGSGKNAEQFFNTGITKWQQAERERLVNNPQIVKDDITTIIRKINHQER